MARLASISPLPSAFCIPESVEISLANFYHILSVHYSEFISLFLYYYFSGDSVILSKPSSILSFTAKGLIEDDKNGKVLEFCKASWLLVYSLTAYIPAFPPSLPVVFDSFAEKVTGYFSWVCP